LPTLDEIEHGIELGKETGHRFCVACTHIAGNQYNNEDKYRCCHPNNFAGYNLVTGHKIFHVEFCKDVRNDSTLCSVELCGTEGRWYQERALEPQRYDSSFANSERSLDNIAEGAAARVAEIKRRRNIKLTGDDLANL